jgi:carbon-monoxide dehydrogenase small subunit
MERVIITSGKVKTMENTVEINVDGKDYLVSVKAYDTLSRVLRDELGKFGVKRGCDYGGCGACTVSLDGRAVYSCMYPVQNVVGKKVLTVEGLASNGDISHEALSEIQKSFLENGGLQCGYCTAGIMMSTKCLLDKNPSPSLNDVQEALAGNICRCTGYGRVIESIFAAAKQLREKK